jgi:hypothetical protein
VVIGVTFVSFMAVFLVQQIEVSLTFHLPSSNRLLIYPSGSCTTEASVTALWDSSWCRSSRSSLSTSPPWTKLTTIK